MKIEYFGAEEIKVLEDASKRVEDNATALSKLETTIKTAEKAYVSEHKEVDPTVMLLLGVIGIYREYDERAEVSDLEVVNKFIDFIKGK